MTDRIGSSTPGMGGLARTAIEAALARHSAAKARIEHAISSSEIDGASAVLGRSAAAGTRGPSGTSESFGASFSKQISEGIRSIDAEVKRADRIADDLIAGRVDDLSEVAATLKQSDLSLRFALEVRNKFIDAYREVMRMSV